MGITNPIWEYEKHVLDICGLRYEGLKWCELGNQRTDKNEIAKEIYLSKGVYHISIDINGKDGALPIDLDYPVPFILLNQFDVVTNYGTIEHINNQYQAFKNVHDMCKKDGIMIHILPLVGHWPNHCRYYYTETFLKQLAEACKYEIISFTILNEGIYKAPKNLIAVAFLKKEDSDFISKKEFNRIPGLIDTGNLEFTGNYSEREYEILLEIIRKLPSPLKKAGKIFLRKIAKYLLK